MAHDDQSRSATPDSVASVESLDLPPEDADSPSPTMPVLVSHMDLRTADYRRRDRDRKMLKEETVKNKRNREIRMREKEEEKKRDMEMLMSFNPWGRPGGGAPIPGKTNRNQVVSKEHGGLSPEEAAQGEGDLNDELMGGFLRGLGRPGAGAPLRTQSGHIQVQISGDPELRFGSKVSQSIENGLRYKGPGKEEYRKELDFLVQQKQENRERERLLQRQEEDEQANLYPFGRATSRERSESDVRFPPLDESTETYHPWGRGIGNPRRDDRGRVHGLKRPPRYAFDPETEDTLDSAGAVLLPPFGGRGGGGAPQRTSTGTLQTKLRHFTGSSEPGRLPNLDEDPGYHPWGRPGHGAPFSRDQGQNFLQKMEDSGMVDLMLEKVVGKPRRDPDTGKLLDQSRGHSDVTSQRLGLRRLEAQDRRQYHSALRRQSEEKQNVFESQKLEERDQLRQHLETWEGLWGKPGNGAPRVDNKRVDLNAVLFANQGEESGLARYARGKDYEFHAPWAAMIY